jgi:hypothetical protein
VALPSWRSVAAGGPQSAKANTSPRSPPQRRSRVPQSSFINVRRCLQCPRMSFDSSGQAPTRRPFRQNRCARLGQPLVRLGLRRHTYTAAPLASLYAPASTPPQLRGMVAPTKAGDWSKLLAREAVAETGAPPPWLCLSWSGSRVRLVGHASCTRQLLLSVLWPGDVKQRSERRRGHGNAHYGGN